MEPSSDKKVIRKDAFPEYLDFDILRSTGISHLGDLAGKIWTDHNVHDPGITILEMLCYALIDLGYRSQLPIEDLLAEEPGTSTGEFNFFTPGEILTNNPVTILDYRKLLIDTPGVRNAWLVINKDHKMYVNKTGGDNNPGYELSCTPSASDHYSAVTHVSRTESCDIYLNGLYDVYLELERPVKGCLSDFKKTEVDKILGAVREKLHSHRNLAEDFVNLHVLCEEEISFCGKITLSAGADPGKVYVKILKALNEFLSPPIRFYTLDEMLDRGVPIDKIFSGRPLLQESYGFLDSDEVENAQQVRVIHLSDIYSLIGSIEGVKSVKNLLLKYRTKDNPETKIGDPDKCDYWTHTIKKDHIPVFCPTRTCFDFITDGSLKIQTNKNKVLALYSQCIAINKKVLYAEALDKTLPAGVFRSGLQDYYSIQNEFPRTYGIGDGGLSPEASDSRKAQALQLKGYLLFFDQLLANYMSQLSHIRDIFSFQPDSLRTDESNHTYFGASVDTVPDIDKLVRFYTGNYNPADGWVEGAAVALPVNAEDLATGTLDDAQFKTLTYSTVTERETAIHQLLREFGQNEYDIRIIPDECGFIFNLRTSVSNLRLISKRTYKSEAEARLAAKTITFLATLDKAYNRINNYDAPEFGFEVVFTSLDYLQYLSTILENQSDYATRRKEFLDHLLDRFAEKFTDYALLTYHSPEKTETEKTLDENECKAKFISGLPATNRNRGRAYNYHLNGWENDNISGLEKRVMSLACMEPEGRQALCKFDVVTYGDRFVYQLADAEGNIILSSDIKYNSEAEAKAAYASLLSQLSDPGGFTGTDSEGTFGIRVRHETGSATLNRKYNNPDERDANIRRMAASFGATSDEDNLFVSEYINRLILENEDGTALKESRRHYDSEEEAIKDIAHFKKNINTQLWLVEETEREKITLTSTTIEHVYLDMQAMDSNEFPVKSRYRWSVSGRDGQELLRSSKTFNDSQESMEDMIEFLALENSSLTIRIDTTSNETAVEVSKPDRIVARKSCKNQEEAESVRDKLRKLMGREHPGDRWLRTNELAYEWIAHNEDGDLIKSYSLYSTRRKARAAADHAHRLMGKESNYSVNQMSKGKFVCVLSDSNESIGISTRRFDNEQDARQMIETICAVHASSEVIVDSGKKGYQFIVPSREGEDDTILESFIIYRTKPEAILGLDDLMKVAKKPSNYFPTGDEPNIDFSFVIRENKKYMAAYPVEFDMPADRDKAIDAVLQIMKESQNPFSVKEEFVANLVVEDETLLESTRAFPTRNAARKDMLKCMTYAMDSGNYDERILPGGFSQELILKDDNGRVIARYPKDYVGRLIGARTIGKIKGYAAPNLYRISVDSQPRVWKFRYGWVNPENQWTTLLESNNDFESREDSEKAYRDFLNNLENIIVKDGLEEGSPKVFEDASGKIVGRGTSDDPGFPREAVENYLTDIVRNHSLMAAAPDNPEAIRKIPGMDGGNQVYRLVRQDVHLAIHPCQCGEKQLEALLDRLWTTAINGYQYLEICLAGDICICIDGLYYFVIRDKHSHEIYLRSYTGYADCDEAKLAFREWYIRIIDKASDPSNYGPYNDNNPPYILTALPQDSNAKCDIKCPPEPQPLAVVSEFAADKYTIEELADLMCSYPIRLRVTTKEDCDQEEKVCYYFHLLNPDRGRNDDCKADWESTICYETVREAYEAFLEFLILIRYRGNYHHHLNEEKCCFELVIREVLLESKVGYPEKDDAWAALIEMLKLTCNEENFHVSWDEDTCTFTICVIEQGYILGCAPQLYYQKEQAENQLKIIRDKLKNTVLNQINVSSVKNETDYSFRITDEKQNVLWQSYHTYQSESDAENAGWQAIALARESSFYGKYNGKTSLFSKNKNFLKGGIVLDDADIIAVQGPESSLDPLQLQLEMISYPFDKDDRGFSIKLFTETDSDDSPQVLMTSPIFYSSHGEAQEAFQEIRKAYENNNFEIIEKDNCGRYEICLIDPSKMIACHPQKYMHSDKVKDAIKRIMECANRDGMHLVEHILLRPEKEEDCRCLMPSLPDKSCEIEWPPEEDPCARSEQYNRNASRVKENDTYIPLADPYSFWVTVVLPGWTKRFCQQERRVAFQQLIRKEAPAHIGLNIHWLSPKDMCAFEAKYRRWLRWKSCKEVCGQFDVKCDMVTSLGGLINMPPCEDPDEEKNCDCELPRDVVITDLAINYLFTHQPQVVYGANYLNALGVAGGFNYATSSHSISIPRAAMTSLLSHTLKSSTVAVPLDSTPAVKTETPGAKGTSRKKKIKKKKSMAKSDLARLIRQRMATYKEIMEEQTDTQFSKKEVYQRALLFLSSPAQPDVYLDLIQKLSDAYDRARSENSFSQYMGIITNVTGYFIDQHLAMDPQEVSDEVSGSLKKAISIAPATLKKHLNKRWSPAEWEEWFSSRAARKIDKILSQKT